VPEPPTNDPRDRIRPADAVEIGRKAWASPTRIHWKFTRSGGPGGQHVNTASTRAECRIALEDIGGVHPEAIQRIRAQAGHLLVASTDEIRVVSQEHRSQSQNRTACIARLRALVEACEFPPKTRRKTKPTRGSKERRLKSKREHSQKKQNRNWDRDQG
jgi:ribosome-associated protein